MCAHACERERERKREREFRVFRLEEGSASSVGFFPSLDAMERVTASWGFWGLVFGEDEGYSEGDGVRERDGTR